MVRLFHDKLSCHMVDLSLPEWDRVPDKPTRFRFGYMPPVRPEHGVTPVVVFSPDLIACTTAWLNDMQFDAYMTTIEAMMAAHLEHPDLPSDVVMSRAESDIYAVAPSCLALLHEVEMKAMDSGLVPIK